MWEDVGDRRNKKEAGWRGFDTSGRGEPHTDLIGGELILLSDDTRFY